MREVELKWRADVDEYKGLLSQWKEKHSKEQESRRMLDDNLRVVARRIAELELEVQDKGEKLQVEEARRREAERRAEGMVEN